MKFPNGYPKNHICEKCGKKYLANSPRQKYCGKREGKLRRGCAHEMRKNFLREKSRKDWQKVRCKEYHRKYDKKWRKEQRLQNTPYAIRQRKVQKEYYIKNCELLKLKNKEWRKQNSDKVLFLNRKRAKRLKDIGGSHTYNEWLELKEEFNYCCAICGISEDVLKIKWAGTYFTKLTEDHIVPIEKWKKWIKKYHEVIYKCNDIENIQPACISCNSSKKDKIRDL